MMRGGRTYERHGYGAGARNAPPEYGVWAGIIARCTNPKHPKYPDYGGRGITCCPEWRSSFAAFFASMGSRPSPEHSIERKDNDGPYEPQNCVWATRAVQSRNKRNNVYVEVDGERLCVADAARRVGLKPLTLWMRLDHGWPLAKALGTPVRPRRTPDTRPVPRFVELDGRRVPLAVAAKAAGLPPDVVWHRIKRGWPPERALSTPITTSQRSA